MPNVNPLAMHLCAKNISIDIDVEIAKKHLPRGHFVDEGIQPVDEQDFQIWGLASNARRLFSGEQTYRRDNRCHRTRGILKGFAGACTVASDAHIALMGKLCPWVRIRSFIEHGYFHGYFSPSSASCQLIAPTTWEGIDHDQREADKGSGAER
jgi:hypothetical protein